MSKSVFNLEEFINNEIFKKPINNELIDSKVSMKASNETENNNKYEEIKSPIELINYDIYLEIIRDLDFESIKRLYVVDKNFNYVIQKEIESYSTKLSQGVFGGYSFWSYLGLINYIKELPKDFNNQLDFKKFSDYVGDNTYYNIGSKQRENLYTILSNCFNKDDAELFINAQRKYTHNFKGPYNFNDLYGTLSSIEQKTSKEEFSKRFSNFLSHKVNNHFNPFNVVAFYLQLKEAINADDLNEVKRLVAIGVPFSIRNFINDSQGLIKQHLENVNRFIYDEEFTKEILEGNQDEIKFYINAYDEYSNALIRICKTRDRLDLVKLLIEKGANVNTINSLGATPLHNACKRGNFEVIKFLIEKGADINANDQYEQDSSPLHIVMLNRDIRPIKYFLELDINLINKQNALGETPLITLCKFINMTDNGFYNKDIAILEEFLKHPEIDLSLKDYQRKSVLDYVNENVSTNIINPEAENKKQKIIKLLEVHNNKNDLNNQKIDNVKEILSVIENKVEVPFETQIKEKDNKPEIPTYTPKPEVKVIAENQKHKENLVGNEAKLDEIYKKRSNKFIKFFKKIFNKIDKFFKKIFKNNSSSPKNKPIEDRKNQNTYSDKVPFQKLEELKKMQKNKKVNKRKLQQRMLSKGKGNKRS